MKLVSALVLGLLMLCGGCISCTKPGDKGDPLTGLPQPAADIPPNGIECQERADCDDGLACTENRCNQGVCVTSPLTVCDWPAESIYRAKNLTGLGGPFWDNKFYNDLSGAVWNPETRQLWVCRNTLHDSRIWVLNQDEKGDFEIGSKNGNRGEWAEFGDLEGLTLANLEEPETIYLIVEREGLIQEVDLSSYGSTTIQNSWDISRDLVSGWGAEAITFVPDRFLAAQDFVDAGGMHYQSKGGMGGLMLVGYQYGGAVYAFDLDRKEGTFSFVGRYQSDGTEVSGLEFDRSTGHLYIWHGGDVNQLEVARLSSSRVGSERKLDTITYYDGPGYIIWDNQEGIAITSNDDCVSGKRSFFLTTDHGNFWSLMQFQDFPCTE